MKAEPFFELSPEALGKLVGKLGKAAFSSGEAVLTDEECGYVLDCINMRTEDEPKVKAPTEVSAR